MAIVTPQDLGSGSFEYSIVVSDLESIERINLIRDKQVRYEIYKYY